jgi:hypothetical protein
MVQQDAEIQQNILFEDGIFSMFHASGFGNTVTRMDVLKSNQ